MSAIWTIARKEYQLAMRSITSYIVSVLFLVISGSFFATTVFKVGLAEMRGLYSFQHILFVFFIPAITMGSIARERSSGTIELLSTLPIRLSHVIWGKILSAFMQVFTMLIFNIIPFAIIGVLGQTSTTMPSSWAFSAYSWQERLSSVSVFLPAACPQTRFWPL